MNRIYSTMSAGILFTFAVAWTFGNTPSLLSMIFDAESGNPTILGWISIFSPLVIILIMGMGLKKLPNSVQGLIFLAMSGLIGLSMSSIFVTYTDLSIANAFLVTSIAFAGLSLWGYTTKKDISGWGSFLLMGLIGIIVASIFNIFIGSSAMDFALSVISLLIFAGLTAWDTQRIKSDFFANPNMASPAWEALSLYLNFINMFMSILQIFGNRE